MFPQYLIRKGARAYVEGLSAIIVFIFPSQQVAPVFIAESSDSFFQKSKEKYCSVGSRRNQQSRLGFKKSHIPQVIRIPSSRSEFRTNRKCQKNNYEQSYCESFSGLINQLFTIFATVSDVVVKFRSCWTIYGAIILSGDSHVFAIQIVNNRMRKWNYDPLPKPNKRRQPRPYETLRSRWCRIEVLLSMVSASALLVCVILLYNAAVFAFPLHAQCTVTW